MIWSILDANLITVPTMWSLPHSAEAFGRINELARPLDRLNV